MVNSDNNLKLNSSENRLELEVEEQIAYVDYKLSDQDLFLNKVKVPDDLQGKGIGSNLVEKTLQFAKINNYKIVPVCPFVKSYLKDHPDWNDIVSDSAQ